MRIAIKAAYIGRDFFGSQMQPDKRTVEGELLKALEKCAHIRNFQPAGRTDSGVSSLGMVFAFDCESRPKTGARHPLNLGRLNHHLPKDMCAYALAEAPDNFNPRFAKERHYRYFLSKGTVQAETVFIKAPNLQKTRARELPSLQKARTKELLGLEKMRAAAKLLEGTHDFSNFCKKSERNPVRTIKKIKVSKKHIDFFAESFLWQQVRRMACFIVRAGKIEGAKQTTAGQQGAFQTDAISGRAAAGTRSLGETAHVGCTGKGIATPAKDPFAPGNPVPPLPPENLLLANIKYPQIRFETDLRMLSGFRSRMETLAEKKRVEQLICASFLRCP